MESGGKRHKAPDAVMRCLTKAAGGRKGSFQLTVQCSPSGKEGQQQELGQLAALHPQSGSREQCMLLLDSLSHFYEV